MSNLTTIENPAPGRIVEKLRQVVENNGSGGGHLEFWALSENARTFNDDDSITRGLDDDAELTQWLEQAQKNMRCVVMVIPASSIEPAVDEAYVTIKSRPLRDRKVSKIYHICKGTKYADQPSAFCFGSGFFIKEKEAGEKIVATAAHLIVRPGLKIENIRFVHAIFAEDEEGFKHGIRVHKSQVYKPVADELPVTDYELFFTGGDWALLRVVPAYEAFPTPQIEISIPDIQQEPLQDAETTQLYAFGHGLGLPMKISIDGHVLESNSGSSKTGQRGTRPSSPNKEFFESNITLLGGNSGSPVFSHATHELVGIYMRGTKKLKGKSGTSDCLEVKNNEDYNNYEGQECLRVHEGTRFHTRRNKM